jgi:predicted PurR-regulated permease PerM
VSRPWSESTKRWVVVGLIIAGAIIFYMVRKILFPVILALLLAYLLNPLVERLMKIRLSRALATILTYFILLIALAGGTSILVPMVVQQVSSINLDFVAIYESVRQIVADYQTITILDVSIELSAIFQSLEDRLIDLATGFASRSAEELVEISFGVASGFVSTFVWLIFILVVSFWLIKDADKMMGSLAGLIPLDYRDDVEGLGYSVGDVWNSFFRGLLLLSLIVGVITGVTMWLAGVKNALLLGMLAGVLEVVPTFGPVIAAIPGVAVAFFQGSTHLPVANGWFALLVLGLYVMIQQVENNLLAPRIIGASVKLHPLVVLVGAIGGYSIGGILGAFLAAPVIGTSRILGEYIYKKLVELEHIPEVPKAAEMSAEGTEPLTEEVVATEQDDELC